jgi:hypothetical protein
LGGRSGWTIANQTLQYNGTSNSQLFAGNSAWTDYTLNALFKLSNLLDYPGGLRGRVDPNTGSGYMLWIYPALSQIILYRASAWDISQPLAVLGQSSALFDIENVHNLSLVFEGSRIQVVYDGKVIITAADSTLPNGLVALEGMNQTIGFQSVQVTSSDANNSLISASSPSLAFTTNYGAGDPSQQTVQISGSAGEVLAWTASASVPWLTVSPVSGFATSALVVSVNSSSLSPGTYDSAITLTSFGSAPDTLVIPVSLTVAATPPAIALPLPA